MNMPLGWIPSLPAPNQQSQVKKENPAVVFVWSAVKIISTESPLSRAKSVWALWNTDPN